MTNVNIKIDTLSIRNFKGTSEKHYRFSGSDTNVYGQNGSGKSTIMDAWTWLLFGKSGDWSSDFGIKPVGMSRPEVEVEAVITVDDTEVTIKKIMTEKWTTKRGFAEESFTGHETRCFVNGIERKATDYKAYIDSMVTEETFKRLTSAQVFLTMKKPDMRKVLIDMAGNVSDSQVAGTDEQMQSIVALMSEKGYSLDDVSKLCKQQLTAFTAEQTNISPRIDELRRIMPEDQDWTKLESGLEKGREYLRKIDEQMASGNASLMVMKKKQGDMFALQSKIDQMKRDRLEQANAEFFDLSRQKDSLSSIIKVQSINEQNLLGSIEDYDKEIKRLTDSLLLLKQQYIQVAGQKKAIETQSYQTIQKGNCDRCGQALPDDQLVKINIQSEERFQKEKDLEIARLDARLKDITEQGQDMSFRKKDKQNKKEEAQAELTKCREELLLANQARMDIDSKLAGKSPAIAIDLTGDIEYDKLTAELERIKAELEKPEDNSSVLLENKNKITAQMETIRGLLTGRSEREKAIKRIADLEERGKELAGLIALEKQRQFIIEKFTRKKSEMLEGSINALFEGVTFRLFDTQINGGVVDDCTPIVNGVEYSDASHSEQIRASMAMVKAFQKQERTYVPVFVDNAEACNYFNPMDTQVIKLFVSDDEEIRIESEIRLERR